MVKIKKTRGAGAERTIRRFYTREQLEQKKVLKRQLNLGGQHLS
jgi:hypothetical protein